jgi:hypothetical protein
LNKGPLSVNVKIRPANAPEIILAFDTVGGKKTSIFNTTNRVEVDSEFGNTIPVIDGKLRKLWSGRPFP